MRISFAQGSGSLMHNNREYSDEQKLKHTNIDFSRTEENVILKNVDLKKAYEELFKSSVEEYNAKQKKPCRRIDDYLKKIKNSKAGEKTFYEDVVQIGKMEDFQEHPELRETAKEILIEYANEFEKRNPNLKLIGAYLHMDEASPHLHIDYIPVATGYKTGMQKRNSLNRALEQQNPEFKIPKKDQNPKNNAVIFWDKSERLALREICTKYGIEIEAERPKERLNRTVEQERQFHRDQEELQKREEALQEKQKKASELEQVEILKSSEMHLKENKIFEKTPVVTVRESDLEKVNLALNHLKNENRKLRKKNSELESDLQFVQKDREDFSKSMMYYLRRAEDLEKDKLLSKNEISSAIEETYDRKAHRPFMQVIGAFSESLKKFAEEFDRYPQVMAACVLRNVCESLSSFIDKSMELAQKRSLEHEYERTETHSRGIHM